MRYLAIFTLLLLSFIEINAQCAVVLIEDKVGEAGDTITVDMSLSGINALAAFAGTITYDPSILTFISFEGGADLDFGTNSNEPTPGQINIIGFDLSGQLVSDFSVLGNLAKLNFVLSGTVGSTSEISFNNQLTEIQFNSIGVDGLPVVVPVCEIIDGSLSISDTTLPPPTSCPIVSIENQIGAPGDTITVDMDLSGIDPLLAIQGTITYDPSILTFVSHEEGTNIDSDFSINVNEFVPGVLVVVGFDVLNQGIYSFSDLKNLVKFNFALNGAANTFSDIAFNNQQAEIEFVSSVAEGPIGACDIINGSISISGTPPPPPMDFEVSTVVTNALCNQTTLGSISAIGFFGVPPYTFSWTGANNFASTQQNITNLSPGFYNLTATDSGNGLVIIDGIQIQEVGGEFEVEATILQNYCDTGMEGAILINTTMNNTGGPLTFNWSNGSTSESIINLSNGFYDLTVTDNSGCTQVHEFEINSSREFSIEFELNPACEGESNGSIYALDIDGGLTFYWSTGAVTDSLENLEAGTYDVTIEEPNACLQVATFEIAERNENSNLIIDATCSSLDQNNGSISPSFVGDLAGTSLSNVSILNATSVSSSMIDLAPGIYSITGTSINGCAYSASATIEESLSGLREDYFTCLLDSIQFETSSNNSDLLYSWSPDSSFVIDSIANPIFVETDFMGSSLTATLLTSGGHGCTRSFDFNIIQTDDCVWPGDTNEDKMVSAADLLHIAIANGDAGPARPEANITEWFTQPATLWQENIGVTTLDKMFADCNGDGLINDDDVLVVSQNNGLSHLNFTGEEELDRAMGVPLFVDLEPNYLDNVEHDINLVLGEIDDQAMGAYGVAFQIKYDPATTIITAGSFKEQGWLSEDGTTTWDIEFADSDVGLLDVAVTRTNGAGLDGFGAIATFKSTFIADLKSEIQFEIINAILLTADAVDIPVLAIESSSVIGTSSAHTLEANLYNEKIYPNPTTDFVRVKSDRSIDNYIIYNTIGQTCMNGNLSQSQIEIDQLIPGMYTIQFNGSDGITSHKLIVK